MLHFKATPTNLNIKPKTLLTIFIFNNKGPNLSNIVYGRFKKPHFTH